MRHLLLISSSSVSLLALLAMPIQTIAQEQQNVPHPPHYVVTDLGTLGGTFSLAYGVNASRQVGGVAQLAGGNQHAFVWRDDHMTDLGTLGGPNSVAGGPAETGGQWAILSDTSATDPLGEDFCGFGTNLICLGAVWEDGEMIPLATLGGNNAEAFTANDRGQVVGAAENATYDLNCPLPQVLRFEAVMWGPRPGEIRELRPLHGDSVGFALGLNDLGQAVGSSGSCADTTTNSVTGLVAGPHAVLWDCDGSATDLGNLGGKLINTGAAINNRGEVVGGSDLPGDKAAHAFLWTREKGMQDLGTLGTDPMSLAGWINNTGQVVGWSCDADGNCRAYFWQDNVMTDLNTLIPSNSPLYLMNAFGINDSGEIAGLALQISTGDVHAFLATPCEWCKDDKAGTAAPDVTTARPRVVLPAKTRELLQQRLRIGQFGSGFLGPR